jgi:hypothetical protein
MEYITTDTSYRKLAQKYGENHAVIGQRAKAEKWVALRRQHLDKTQTKTLNAIASQQATRAARIAGAGDKLLDRVVQLLESDEESVLDTGIMRDLSVVLKNLKEVQMIRSEMDRLEQQARIDKLQREAEAQNGSREPVRVVIEGDLGEYTK